jgi:hypothetical protein
MREGAGLDSRWLGNGSRFNGNCFRSGREQALVFSSELFPLSRVESYAE